MKKKDLKKLAARFIRLESVIEANKDNESVKKAKEEIMTLSSHIPPVDMLELDAMIQEELQKS